MTPEKIVELMGDRDFVQIRKQPNSSYVISFVSVGGIRIPIDSRHNTILECFVRFDRHVNERDSVTPEEIVQLMRHELFFGVEAFQCGKVSVCFKKSRHLAKDSTKPADPLEAFGEFKRAISEEKK